jgi:uridylate kinase
MPMIHSTPYRRVLLKLSGESFARQGERGISMDEVVHIARQTVQAVARGVAVACWNYCALWCCGAVVL